jgi:hypothetical protein
VVIDTAFAEQVGAPPFEPFQQGHDADSLSSVDRRRVAGA